MVSRSLIEHFRAHTGLAGLSAHAEQLIRLQGLYENALPAALAHGGRVANLKRGKVVIHAASSAVAAKIRQLTPRLADVFRQSGVDVSEIQVKVQPEAAFHPPQKQHVASMLGITAKQALTSLRSRLPEDSPLKSALERLLDRSK